MDQSDSSIFEKISETDNFEFHFRQLEKALSR